VGKIANFPESKRIFSHNIKNRTNVKLKKTEIGCGQNPSEKLQKRHIADMRDFPGSSKEKSVTPAAE